MQVLGFHIESKFLSQLLGWNENEAQIGGRNNRNIILFSLKSLLWRHQTDMLTGPTNDTMDHVDVWFQEGGPWDRQICDRWRAACWTQDMSRITWLFNSFYDAELMILKGIVFLGSLWVLQYPCHTDDMMFYSLNMKKRDRLVREFLNEPSIHEITIRSRVNQRIKPSSFQMKHLWIWWWFYWSRMKKYE